jgi:hypothetical protein
LLGLFGAARLIGILNAQNKFAAMLLSKAKIK